MNRIVLGALNGVELDTGERLGVGPIPRRAPTSGGEGSLAIVWLNTRTGVYYCSGSRWYGATAYGTFVTEREALTSGARPEFGERC